MIPVELSTERLVLTQPRPTDRDDITEYCREPLFEGFMTTPWPYEHRHADFFIEEYVPGGWISDAEYTWALRHEEQGPLLGVIGYRTAGLDIGYWLGAPHRGQGLMVEATEAVVTWLFASGVERIRWECIQGNLASASVARRAGFTYTHTGPASAPHRDGSEATAWHAERRPSAVIPSSWPVWPPERGDTPG